MTPEVAAGTDTQTAQVQTCTFLICLLDLDFFSFLVSVFVWTE